MKFNLDKCKISNMVKGTWTDHSGYEIDNQGTVLGITRKESINT